MLYSSGTATFAPHNTSTPLPAKAFSVKLVLALLPLNVNCPNCWGSILQAHCVIANRYTLPCILMMTIYSTALTSALDSVHNTL